MRVVSGCVKGGQQFLELTALSDTFMKSHLVKGGVAGKWRALARQQICAGKQSEIGDARIIIGLTLKEFEIRGLAEHREDFIYRFQPLDNPRSQDFRLCLYKQREPK